MHVPSVQQIGYYNYLPFHYKVKKDMEIEIEFGCSLYFSRDSLRGDLINVKRQQRC